MARTERHDITASALHADMMHAAEANEPIEATENADPMEPIEANDPTEPILSAEFFDHRQR